MGLDITFTSKATPVTREQWDEARAKHDDPHADPIDIADGNDWRILWRNHDFPRQHDIADAPAFTLEDPDWFRAGSYSGYSHWRRCLAALVGISDIEAWWSTNPSEGPFVDLLYFSDCEGTIGPATAARLACDFAEWQSRADLHEDEYWRRKYGEWRRAFETAAQGGVVIFH